MISWFIMQGLAIHNDMPIPMQDSNVIVNYLPHSFDDNLLRVSELVLCNVALALQQCKVAGNVMPKSTN